MKQIGIEITEKVLNKMLTWDRQSLKLLAPLQDRVLCVVLPVLNLPVYATLRGEAFVLAPEHEEAADLTVKVKPGFIIERLTGAEAGVGSRNLQIEGDVACASALKAFIEGYDIDFEARLASVFGDYLGHHMSQAGKGVAEYVGTMREHCREDVKSFLQDERSVLAPSKGISYFYDQVDVLRSDVDRLEARIARLTRQLETSK